MGSNSIVYVLYFNVTCHTYTSEVGVTPYTLTQVEIKRLISFNSNLSSGLYTILSRNWVETYMFYIYSFQEQKYG